MAEFLIFLWRPVVNCLFSPDRKSLLLQTFHHNPSALCSLSLPQLDYVTRSTSYEHSRYAANVHEFFEAKDSLFPFQARNTQVEFRYGKERKKKRNGRMKVVAVNHPSATRLMTTRRGTYRLRYRDSRSLRGKCGLDVKRMRRREHESATG